jgi:hypothetical protein
MAGSSKKPPKTRLLLKSGDKSVDMWIKDNVHYSLKAKKILGKALRTLLK